MAKKESPASTDAPAKARGATKVVWDDKHMRSTYANATNVVGGREEIVLLFGLNQAWHAGQKEITVQLTDRVILSPYAAKRLSVLLQNVLQDYEKRFGTLDLDVGRPTSSTMQ